VDWTGRISPSRVTPLTRATASPRSLNYLPIEHACFRCEERYRSHLQLRELRRLLPCKNSAELRTEYAPNGERLLVHLSNFRPVKRVTDGLEIFDRVRKKMPAKLLLIGDGPDRSVAEWLAVQKGLHEDVLFLASRIRYRKAGDWPHPANAQRTRIFRSGGTRGMGLRNRAHRNPYRRRARVIEHGVSGYLADVGDVDTMARYAIELLNDESALRSMGKASRAVAKARFCSSKSFHNMKSFTGESSSVLRKRPRGSLPWFAEAVIECGPAFLPSDCQSSCAPCRHIKPATVRKYSPSRFPLRACFHLRAVGKPPFRRRCPPLQSQPGFGQTAAQVDAPAFHLRCESVFDRVLHQWL